jgi:hypothetical protein
MSDTTVVWAATRRAGLDFHALGDGLSNATTTCGRSTASVTSVTFALAAAIDAGMKPCGRCWPSGLPATATECARCGFCLEDAGHCQATGGPHPCEGHDDQALAAADTVTAPTIHIHAGGA